MKSPVFPQISIAFQWKTRGCEYLCGNKGCENLGGNKGCENLDENKGYEKINWK